MPAVLKFFVEQKPGMTKRATLRSMMKVDRLSNDHRLKTMTAYGKLNPRENELYVHNDLQWKLVDAEDGIINLVFKCGSIRMRKLVRVKEWKNIDYCSYTTCCGHFSEILLEKVKRKPETLNQKTNRLLGFDFLPKK